MAVYEESLRSNIGTTGKVKIIQNNLNDRYKDAFCITQELLQNADDAGAEHVRIGIADRFSDEHELASSPGLFYINDGLLTQSDLRQIFNIGDSNKSDATEKIGKFGLGMKSVFHICEAFFIFAFQNEGDLKHRKIVQFFDPWDTPDEEELLQRPDHYQWRKDFENKKEQLFDALAAYISAECKGLKRWFCIWLPLRTQKQYDDSPIFPFLPSKESTAAQFNDQNCIKIARMFPFMKYVQEIAFLGDLAPKGTLSIKASRRFTGDSEGKLDCQITSSKELFQEIDVIGNENLSTLQKFADLQKDPHWPKTWGVDKAGRCRTLHEKAKPHFAVAIQQQKSTAARLTLKFFVYLPLTDQRMCETVSVEAPQFPYAVDLNLHAHFFVDAGRQRFEINNGDGKDPIKMEWNREILHKGLLAGVLPVFARAVTQKNDWEHVHCSQFIRTFTGTEFYSQYKDYIHQNSCFVDQLSQKLDWSFSKKNDWNWAEHKYNNLNFRKLPGSIVQCESVAKAVMKAFPDYCLINADASNIIQDDRVLPWEEKDVAKLQKAILNLPADKKYASETIQFLCDFYEKHAELTVSFLQAYFSDITNLIYKRNEQALNKLLSTGNGIICPVHFSKSIWEPRPFDIWFKLMQCAQNVLPVPVADTTEEARLRERQGQYSREDIKKITSKLELLYKENNIEEMKSALRSVVCNLIRNGSILPSEPEFADAKIFPAQNLQEIFSLNELLGGYTFTQGDTNIFGDFCKLLPETKIIIINQDYSLELSKRCPEMKNASFSLVQHGREIISGKPFVAEDLDLRMRIIVKLCDNPDENFFSIRYLLHRDPALYNSREELWISNMDAMSDATKTWEKLLHYLLKQSEKELTTIPLDLVHSIPRKKYESLKIRLQNPDEVIKSIDASKIMAADFSWINNRTHEHILDHVNLSDENVRRKLRELPIYPVRDGSFTKLGNDTFLETDTMIPVEFYDQVKCLKIDAESYQRKVIDNLSVKVWRATDTVAQLVANANYHKLTNLREILWDAIEGLAQDHLSLNNEQINFIKQQKLLRVRQHSQKLIVSYNDVLPLEKKIDFGTKSANELGLYYYAELDPDDISEEAWKYAKEKFCITNDEMIEVLSDRLSKCSVYSVGRVCKYFATLDDFLNAFLESEVMPLAKVIHSLRSNSIPGNVLWQKLSVQGMELSASRMVEVCNFLAHQIENSTSPLMKFYKEYLSQAVAHSEYSSAVLPKLLLFDENWALKEPKLLVHSVEGIAPEYLLNKEFSSIIPNLKKTTDKRQSGLDEGFVEEPEHITQLSPEEWAERTGRSPELLKKYFADWDSALYPYIGAFIVLCDDSPAGCELARNYNPQNKKNIRSLLKTETPIGENRYLIFEICSEEPQELASLTGERLMVHLDAPDRLKNLLVGGTWDSCNEFRGDGVHKGFHLVMRGLSAANLKKFSADQLKKLLRATLEQVIAAQVVEAVSLDDLWNHLKKTVQFDLETTQSLILDQLPSHLPGLGLKDGRLKSQLKTFNSLITTREEARQLGNRDVLAETEDKICKVKKELADLLSATADVHKELLTALRGRITKHYGYDVKSVPVELFQNADDATSELLHMIRKTREEHSLPFVIRETDASVNIVHWGRPINKYNDYGFTDGENLGFRQDLQKMMLLLQSHKEDGDIDRTGKFGLGFKSTYLLTDSPHVASGALKFSIFGGIFPVKAEEMISENLEKIIHKVESAIPALPANAPAPTVFDLPYREDVTEKLDFDLIKSFAPYLCMFAKAISSIIVMPKGAPQTTYSVYGLKHDQYSKLFFGERNFGVFSMKSGTIVLGVATSNNNCFVPVSDQIPTFWVTGPTKECWKLGFVVNGNFSVDVGRTHLIEADNTNIGLARQIGVEFFRHLKNYFGRKIDCYVCSSLWKTMTNSKGWNSVLEQENIGSILREMIWGTRNAPNGYGRFLFEYPVIPLGFEENANSLIALKDVKYIANHALSDNRIWSCIKDWAIASTLVDTKFMLNSENGKFLKMIYEDLDVCEISPADLLTHFYQGIASLEPKMLNCVSWKKLIKVLKDNYFSDFSLLIAACKNWQFKSEAKTYMNLSDLVVKHNPEKPDEDRRYAFAPDENRLNSEYSEDVVAFFVVIRGKIEVSTETLKEWCLSAKDQDRRNAVIDYLISGELGDAVAKLLRDHADWIKDRLKTMDDRNTAAIIAGKMRWADELFPQDPGKGGGGAGGDDKGGGGKDGDDKGGGGKDGGGKDGTDDGKKVPDWNEWFDLSDFERKCAIEKYNKKVYGTPEIKALSSEDREEWLKLFILGMSHRLGRTKIEAHREFINFCRNQLNWIDLILNSDKDNLDAKEWIEVLNRYLAPSRLDAETYRYWMQLYPAIYQIAIHLDEYIDAMLQWNKNFVARKIEDVICFRTSAIYRGSEYDMPSLRLALGTTGSHFVIRELLRSGTVKNQSLHQFAFVPSEQNFALLPLDQNKKSSNDIYDYFKSQELSDPTFNNQFDVAFDYFRSKGQ